MQAQLELPLVACALLAAIMFSTSLFTMMHYDPLRSLFPLMSLLILRTQPYESSFKRSGVWRVLLSGIFCGLSVFWSPEYAIAGAACAMLCLIVSKRVQDVMAWLGAFLVALFVPLPWAGGRWLELLANHLQFIPERAGGYGAIPFPWRGYVFTVVPLTGALLLLTGLFAKRKDVLLAALGAYTLATAYPAIVRADRLHIDQAALPLMAATARFAMRLPRSRGLWFFAVVLIFSTIHAVQSQEPSLLDLRSRWNIEHFREETRKGWRKLPLEPRMVGLVLDFRETEFYERVTKLLRCAALPDEKIFLLSNSLVFYFLADRLPATQFPLFFIRHTPRQQTELVAELERNAPRYILISDSVGIDRHASLTHPALYDYMSTHYDPLVVLKSMPIPDIDLQDVRVTLTERRDSFHAGVGKARMRNCR